MLRRSWPRPPSPVAVVLLVLALGAGACGGGVGDSGPGDTAEAADAGIEGTASRDAVSLSEAGLAGSARGFHLLLVTLDTVRADHLGSYGHAAARTPHLDGLAAAGVRFSRAVAPAPLTLPSHATLLTGLDLPRHGVRDNAGFQLGDDFETLAEVLRREGYRTGAFVGSYALDSRFGLDQGFERYDDDMGETGPARDFFFHERTADRVTDSALGWLEETAATEAAEEPFFAWVHYFDAHAPYKPPPGSAATHPYDGEIAFVDSQVGRLLAFLEERGLAERTLVVVTADHGEGLGEHGEPTHGRFLYESTLRVPLILASPGLPAGPFRVEDRLVGLVDVRPTVLELLGVGPVEPIEAGDGMSLLAAPPPERSLYVETLGGFFGNGWAPLHGLRLQDAEKEEKLILAPRSELYDLAADPGEERNLYEERSGRAEALRGQLEALLAGWEAAPAQAPALDAEQRQRLAALGYVRLPPATTGELPDPKDRMETFNRLMLALALNERGRSRDALEIVQKALEETPDEPLAWQAAHQVYRRLGNLQEAERALRRLLTLSPNAEAYAILARLYVSTGRLDEVEPLLDAALELDSTECTLYTARGDLYALTGRLAEAVPQFERAIAEDPVRCGKSARRKLEAARGMLARRGQGSR